MSVSHENCLRRICTIIEDNTNNSTAYFVHKEEIDEHTNELYDYYEIHIDTDFVDWYGSTMIFTNDIDKMSEKDEHNIIDKILKEYKEWILGYFFKYKYLRKEEK